LNGSKAVLVNEEKDKEDKEKKGKELKGEEEKGNEDVGSEGYGESDTGIVSERLLVGVEERVSGVEGD